MEKSKIKQTRICFLLGVLESGVKVACRIYSLKKRRTKQQWTLSSSTWHIYPHLEHNTNFLSKSRTAIFAQFLMPVIKCNFRKIWLTDLEKSFKMLLLGSKMTYLPYFGYNKNFLQEDGSLHFLCVYWTLPLCKKSETGVTDGRTDGQRRIHRILWQSRGSKK